MADRGMTPSEFGLRVRSHPAGLVITAANKMRNGSKMTVSYSAGISETISFDPVPAVNGKNRDRFNRFITSLGTTAQLPTGNRVWRGVPGQEIADLLADISVHPGSRKARGDYLARYIRLQNSVGGLENWAVALISNQGGGQVRMLGGHEVYPLRRGSYLGDSLDQAAVYRIRRLVSPTDEVIDLTDEQWRQALEQTVQKHRNDGEGSRHLAEPRRPSGPYIRRVRDPRNGLLLIYPLDKSDTNGVQFVGFAASFPAAENDTPVEYFVNSIY